MYNIKFNNRTYQCRNDETLLQAFLRQGVTLSFSCGKGSCHVCMMQCMQGELPGQAQAGLRTDYVEQGYFLPCQCQPDSDMVIGEIDRSQRYITASVYRKELLSDNVCRLLLDCDQFGDYRAGQFVTLSRPADGLARCYSLASYPGEDYYLEFHIKRMQNGAFSNWVFDELQEQDAIEIQGPMGHCHYQAPTTDTPLLMMAGGTGLAPLLGIVRQALAENHSGPIHLYHQGSSSDDLYLHNDLCKLALQYDNFSYFPCIPGDSGRRDVFADSAINIIHRLYPDLQQWQVYLAGSPALVEKLQQECLQRDVPEQRIIADPFDMKNLRRNRRSNAAMSDPAGKAGQPPAKLAQQEVPYPPADPEIWAALDQGKKLYKILDDFYSIVYEDARLAPFFQKITKQRSIEKVYLFLRQVFSGEKVYFGDRPRNAHHWMVISDDLFDYREDIMEQCLRNNGLPEHLIRRWRRIEESFRPDIVKDRPWNKVMHGIELPLDGYEELVLDSGSLCDSCQQPIEAGTRVRYHLRLGTIYCPVCMAKGEQPS